MFGKVDFAPEATRNAPVVTVSALIRNVRDLLEHRYPLQWVSGEISNYTLARSGHAYFVLKDAQAQVRCVMFRQRHQFLDWRPEDGMRVEVRALLTLYEARGDVQLTVEAMRRAGIGLLFEQFQRLRDKLAAEGLFEAELKRPLPDFPRVIGVVTSSAAAALHDVVTTLGRRNPAIPVIVASVPVQGQGAAQRIAEALTVLGRGRCDVIVLARGGGSIEDLWAFNEEVVARAIRGCGVPVVTGIGHETDFTIADFAADVRAPTPTAAAELVTPDRAALLNGIAGMVHRLRQHTDRCMERRMQRLDGLGMRLKHPGERLQAQLHRVQNLQERLRNCLRAGLAKKRWRLDSSLHRSLRLLPRPLEHHGRLHMLLRHMRMALQTRLTGCGNTLAKLEACLLHINPERVLARGYSIVRDSRGAVVTSGDQVNSGDTLDITLARGGAKVKVEETR